MGTAGPVTVVVVGGVTAAPSLSVRLGRLPLPVVTPPPGVTGASAWSRLFSEQVSALEVQLPGEDAPVPLDVALAKLLSADREERRQAAEGVTAALQPGLRTRAYIYNTLMADKATDDRLRKYPSWIASRNLSNEASDESVAALIEAVRGRYELPRPPSFNEADVSDKPSPVGQRSNGPTALISRGGVWCHLPNAAVL